MYTEHNGSLTHKEMYLTPTAVANQKVCTQNTYDGSLIHKEMYHNKLYINLTTYGYWLVIGYPVCMVTCEVCGFSMEICGVVVRELCLG